MPYKDPEQRREAGRRWYAAHREQVIAEVAERKRRLYSGVCKNCGGPTLGGTKQRIPEWCGKPECRSMQLRVRYWGENPPPRTQPGRTDQ